jgi:hypothetical protein
VGVSGPNHDAPGTCQTAEPFDDGQAELLGGRVGQDEKLIRLAVVDGGCQCLFQIICYFNLLRVHFF